MVIGRHYHKEGQGNKASTQATKKCQDITLNYNEQPDHTPRLVSSRQSEYIWSVSH